MTAWTTEKLRASDRLDTRDIIEAANNLALELDAEEREPNGDEAALLAFVAEGENGQVAEDWQYGATMIREDTFVDYARELAEDIGAVPADFAWPCTHIDWEAAAEALKTDYNEIDLLGYSYYVR